MTQLRCLLILSAALCTTAIAETGDGGKIAPRAAWTTSRVIGSPDPPPRYRLVEAFGALAFDHPTCVAEIPDADRLMVAEMTGRLFSFPKQGAVAEADLVADLATFREGEHFLMDFAFDPNFRQNRRLFVSYVLTSVPDKTETHLVSFTLSDESPPRIEASSAREIMSFTVKSGHSGGCIDFDAEGFLYMSVGDSWGPNPPDFLNHAQNIATLPGSILRIDVNQPAGGRPYSVPVDNPFVDLDGARPEIWAFGFRNPWKMAMDRRTGRLWVADNGWESWEMIHAVDRGGNHGWPIMEGRAKLRDDVAQGPARIVPPAKDHSHAEANSVIGGVVYDGDKLPEFEGWFLYGDYVTGTVWALRTDASSDDEYDHQTVVDSHLRIVDFCSGSRGEIFVLDHDYSGKIYELLPAELPRSRAPFPQRLSDTGLFASLSPLVPADGVVPYEVRAEQWNDGARATRWIALPQRDVAVVSATAVRGIDFPDGTVLVKHLTLADAPGPGRAAPLETQLLHFESGDWRPYSYVWDEQGQEAQLADSGGETRTIMVGEGETRAGATPGGQRSWYTSARTECRLCHQATAGFVLGFAPEQLNRDVLWQGELQPQLSGLVAHGVLDRLPTLDDAARLENPYDDGNSLEDRARSYLEVNCGMCHDPRGDATIPVYFRRPMTLAEAHVFRSPGVGKFDIDEPRMIVPGEPYRSMVVYRMAKLGYARMPHVGSEVVDSAALRLLEAWISALPAEATIDPKTQSYLPETGGGLYRGDLAATERDAILTEMLSRTEGALELACAIYRGAFQREEDLRRTVELGGQSPSSHVRGLFESFVPEEKRAVRLGTNIDSEAIFALEGDPTRGRLIYLSDGARCRHCHPVDDEADALGPDLRESVKQYSPRDLLAQIIDPSIKIDPRYAQYMLMKTDGQVLTGLLSSQDDGQVVLTTADKEQLTIPRSEIDELKQRQVSLMPQFLLSDMTPQEAADLLAFLLSIQ